MLVLKNKKLAVNEEMLSSVAVTTDDGAVTLGLGGNAVTIEAGEDADSIRKEFGLTSKDEDDAAAAKKESKHEAPAVATTKK